MSLLYQCTNEYRHIHFWYKLCNFIVIPIKAFTDCFEIPYRKRERWWNKKKTKKEWTTKKNQIKLVVLYKEWIVPT